MRSKVLLMILMMLGNMASMARAQTLSASDIAKMVDDRMGSVNEYAELLNDPDPDRSLAAMQIMIGLDDPQISRMALQHGLTSTNPAVRRAALKGYFDTQPNLELFFDGSGLDLAQFTVRISNQRGTVNNAGVGFVTYRVGAFDDKLGCYVYHGWPDQCYIQLSEQSTIVTLWRRSSPFTLDETGTLRGEMLVDNLTPAVPTTIPIRP